LLLTAGPGGLTTGVYLLTWAAAIVVLLCKELLDDACADALAWDSTGNKLRMATHIGSMLAGGP
jgi:hypothetical protein